MSGRLPRSFYTRDAVTVTLALLGQRLVRVEPDGTRSSGRIVEVEAYLGVEDKAAHTFGGRRSPRNEAMYRVGGTAYVYILYGHHCLNVVASREGEPVAALVRALEPEEGLAQMYARRPKARRDADLCSGPGKLCAALAITRPEHNLADLVDGPTLFIEKALPRGVGAGEVASGPRVGVDYAEEWAAKPLRFWVRGNRHVSKA